MAGLIGRKLGMTQLYEDNGTVIPVTIIEAGPCVVVQRKSVEKDGYESVQLGLVPKKKVKVTKPMMGHFKKAGVQPTKVLKEFRVEKESPLKAGDKLTVEIFKDVKFVDVTGTSKGKGFQGVIKRHGFAGGRASHGSMFHRAPGSIGQAAFPSRVFPGKKLPGRMGGDTVTVRRMKVVKIVPEKNLLLVKGSVPGSRGGYIYIKASKVRGK